jgi:hypothetical protein
MLSFGFLSRKSFQYVLLILYMFTCMFLKVVILVFCIPFFKATFSDFTFWILIIEIRDSEKLF